MNSQLADKQGDRPFLPVGIAVLTISDTRSLSDDRSGEALAGRIEEAGHRLVDRTIAKDEREAIQSAVKAWVARDDIDVVITTGGTGFTGRDITPEALEPLFTKRMDGFSAVFHRISYDKIGVSTIQSRATAGLIDTTFIFALPGSPAATAGTTSCATSSTIATDPAISSRSCPGSMSICGAAVARSDRDESCRPPPLGGRP